MPYSIVQYTGDGATATWSVPFPYISKSDVSVKVAGVSATFTWPTTSTVTITPTPANGAVIEIKRSTSPGSRVVDFGNGANLDEASLDNSALQMFYMAQENLDALLNAITLAPDGKMDATSKILKNLLAGVEATDAVNKGQLDAAALSPVTPAASSIANTPAGNIAATNVQAALNELDTEKAIDANTFHKSGNETAAGNKAFSGTVTAQAALIAQALLDLSAAGAGQIKFPATQNDAADPNTLDDYEEGTWTPSVGGTATYGAQTGAYVKIGRRVFFSANLTINAIGSGSTFVISGLPFIAAMTTACSVYVFGSLATACTSVQGYVATNVINLSGFTAAAIAPNTLAIIGNGTSLSVVGNYSV